MAIALVVGSVAVVTAVSYWFERLGTTGIAVVGALGFLALVCVLTSVRDGHGRRPQGCLDPTSRRSGNPWVRMRYVWLFSLD